MTESSQRRNLLVCLSLAAAIAAVYSPVRHFGFVGFDDDRYITGNPHLRGGLTFPGLVWAFTTPLDQWMPVTWLVRLLEYRWFGLEAGAHHLVNVLFHIVNTLLLFTVLNRMTSAPWRSAMVAALFALHPLHVESVAWITGLKDVLSTCFGILTIWAYVRYVEQRAVHGSRLKVLYGLTLLFYALALMSKPMVVTLPFVLLLLDYWPLGRTRWAKSAAGKGVKTPPGQLLREKFPLFALATVSCVATYRAQRSLGAVASLERIPVGTRIANALLSYGGYLGKTLWPTGLAVVYPLDKNISWTAATIVGVGLVGITAVVIWRVRREPWLATGWLWYLGTLVPVIGLVQVGTAQAMADRYTYVPLVGLFLMLCWSVPSGAMERRILKGTVCAAAVTTLTVCAVLSRIQVGYWKDTEILFRHALNVTRDNLMAHYNLGNDLLQSGKVQEAIGHYEQALRIDPRFSSAYNNLGMIYKGQKHYERATEYFRQALRYQPDNLEARNNLGFTLSAMGRYEEAVGQFRESLRIKPDSADTHNNLGVALMMSGSAQEAIAQFSEALRIRPDFANAAYNLQAARQAQKNPAKPPSAQVEIVK